MLLQTEELEGRVANLSRELSQNSAETQNLRDEAGSQAAELESLHSHRASLTSALLSARRDLQVSDHPFTRTDQQDKCAVRANKPVSLLHFALAGPSSACQMGSLAWVWA